MSQKKIKLIGYILALSLGAYLLYAAYAHNEIVSNQELGQNQIVIIDLTQNNGINDAWYFYTGIVLVCIAAIFFLKNYLSPKTPKSKLLKKLTVQELKITQLMQQGLSNKQIAQELSISLSTVKTHINNIYRKYEVFSRSEFLEHIEN